VALTRRRGRSARVPGPSTLGTGLWGEDTRDMLIDRGLELLSEAEAWELLLRGEVGRVGLTIGGVPAIFPVNYTVLDGTIVFRTAPGAKLSTAMAGNVVAFEVDHHERQGRIGWSVLVVGQCEVVRTWYSRSKWGSSTHTGRPRSIGTKRTRCR
jgi:nitroimidazol reductase NimA-like FMN-containing flavoprotein (pyridoxamine 5'-phosphate oxidase superfamily)